MWDITKVENKWSLIPHLKGVVTEGMKDKEGGNNLFKPKPNRDSYFVEIVKCGSILEIFNYLGVLKLCNRVIYDFLYSLWSLNN